MQTESSLVSLCGRISGASGPPGHVLESDEALHFRLASQTSLAMAYKPALTAADPLGLIMLLYFWRDLGTSELWLRLPSAMAGSVFVGCSQMAGASKRPAHRIMGRRWWHFWLDRGSWREFGRCFAARVPGLRSLFFDRAFAEKSAAAMAAFCFSVFGLVVHYWDSVRGRARHLRGLEDFMNMRPSAGFGVGGRSVVRAWPGGVPGKVHFSHLGVCDSRSAPQVYERSLPSPFLL